MNIKGLIIGSDTQYTDPHLDKDIPMCGLGCAICFWSSLEYMRAKNVAKAHKPNGMQCTCSGRLWGKCSPDVLTL